jgi:hypothetical protein
MKRFIALNVSRLRYDDLAGLASETLVVASRRQEAVFTRDASDNGRHQGIVGRHPTKSPEVAKIKYHEKKIYINDCGGDSVHRL